jgi:hypothetical protein
MSKGKHSEAEMIRALKKLEAGRKAADVARELGVSKHTIYGRKIAAWQKEYSEDNTLTTNMGFAESVLRESGGCRAFV